MGTAPLHLGNPLADGTVYRAFSTKGFRNRKANKVRPNAYYRSVDHTDGLSVGLTLLAAVARLEINYGYCRLSVDEVNRLPHGILVCPDADAEGHALLCNIPFIDGSDEERQRAALIAGALARVSIVETCDHYPPKKQDDSPLPAA